jgi:hypothetical protein
MYLTTTTLRKSDPRRCNKPRLIQDRRHWVDKDVQTLSCGQPLQAVDVNVCDLVHGRLNALPPSDKDKGSDSVITLLNRHQQPFAAIDLSKHKHSVTFIGDLWIRPLNEGSLDATTCSKFAFGKKVPSGRKCQHFSPVTSFGIKTRGSP